MTTHHTNKEAAIRALIRRQRFHTFYALADIARRIYTEWMLKLSYMLIRRYRPELAPHNVKGLTLRCSKCGLFYLNAPPLYNCGLCGGTVNNGNSTRTYLSRTYSPMWVGVDMDFSGKWPCVVSTSYAPSDKKGSV